MKKSILLILILLAAFTINAQTFTSTVVTSIPDAGPVMSIPIVVSGLIPTTIDTIFGVETVCFDITHTYTADLHIWLQAPDGTIAALSEEIGRAHV